jgi:hypothetical protein
MVGRGEILGTASHGVGAHGRSVAAAMVNFVVLSLRPGVLRSCAEKKMAGGTGQVKSGGVVQVGRAN